VVLLTPEDCRRRVLTAAAVAELLTLLVAVVPLQTGVNVFELVRRLLLAGGGLEMLRALEDRRFCHQYKTETLRIFLSSK